MSKHYGGIFDFNTKSNRLVEVNQILEDPKIWDDPKQAQALGKEKKLLEGVVNTLTELNQNITSSMELMELARAENDQETLLALQADSDSYEKIIADLEFRRMFHNEMDPCHCFIDIQAGAGSPDVYENPRSLIDFQISKKFANNKAEIRLSISDILNQRQVFYQNNNTNTDYNNSTDAIRLSRKFGTTIGITLNYSL